MRAEAACIPAGAVDELKEKRVGADEPEAEMGGGVSEKGRER